MKSLYITLNELKQIKCELKFNIVIYLIMPLVIAILSGMIYQNLFNQNQKLPGITVAFINKDGGESSTKFEQLLSNGKLSQSIILKKSGDLSLVKQSLEKGEISAAIIVLPNFTQAVLTGKKTVIKLVQSPEKEGDGIVVADAIRSYTRNLNIISGVNEIINKNQIANKISYAINKEVKKNYVKEIEFTQNKAANSRQYFLVTMLVMFSLFVSTVGASSISKDKEDGIISRLKATTINKWDYFVGKITATFLMSFIQITAFILLTSILLKVSWGSNIRLLLLMIIANAAAISGIAALAAGIFKTKKTLKTVLPLVIMIMSVFGGTFYSIDIVTGFMRNVTKATVNYYLTNGYTNIMAGASFSNIWSNIEILLLIALAGLTIGIISFKYER